MKITKDTQKMTDPNEFGETLRDYCFVNDEYASLFGGCQYGCYSTFKLRDEFRDLNWTSKKYKQLRRVSGNDPGVPFYAYSNDTIHLGWWWDGDGTLVIMEGNKIAINNDCKCSYTWEWVKDD